MFKFEDLVYVTWDSNNHENIESRSEMYWKIVFKIIGCVEEDS